MLIISKFVGFFERNRINFFLPINTIKPFSCHPGVDPGSVKDFSWLLLLAFSKSVLSQIPQHVLNLIQYQVRDDVKGDKEEMWLPGTSYLFIPC
ncbi:MAG: hypothetical protein ED557_09660 [Balneola sp.]|nr:MAG: hypothetical protein ED557_09660 [Balneola sp.]